MVKQADGWESGMTANEHRHAARRYWLWTELAHPHYVDMYYLCAEYHEACADGRTTSAEESDRDR